MAVARFARARCLAKPLTRFFPSSERRMGLSSEVKQTFPARIGLRPVLIFNIGGNQYRLIANADFDERIMVIKSVMIHDEYSGELSNMPPPPTNSF